MLMKYTYTEFRHNRYVWCSVWMKHIGGWQGMHLNKKMEYMRNNHLYQKGENTIQKHRY